MNALKLYEDLKDVNLVAQTLNASPEIVNSNYLIIQTNGQETDLRF